MNNRPVGREKHVTEGGKGVNRRGSSVGGNGVGGNGSRPNSDSGKSGGRAPIKKPNGSSSGRVPGMGMSGLGGSGAKRGGSMGCLILVIIVLIIILLFTKLGRSLLSGFLSASSSGDSGYSSFLSDFTNTSNSNSGWNLENNTGSLDKSVASGSRAKYTSIKGNGGDVVTLMVFLCGTDLEAKYSMATNDLTEMTKATISDNVNLLVYTGGCTKWNNNIVSNDTNQIYKVENGGLKVLEDDLGEKPMTDPDTLSYFIKYCKNNYPADRYDLIFWDHGGGSITGYGYDLKFPKSGSMTLSGINKALKDGGVKFDFVGFDACLMATMETALMLNDYADYLIGSEETEPGIGWYYTDWLTKLSANTSMPTIEIGKNICDDFVDECNKTCRGQQTTLSVIDLAELANTAPDKFTAFAESISSLITDKDYTTVSTARTGAREFATSSRIDQVDLVDLANNMGTAEGKALYEALLSAIKYNKTSSNMTNAYGLSIYFPYKKLGNVDNATNTYESIGMDKSYTKAIQQFASLNATGQIVTGGSSAGTDSLLNSLFGAAMGGSSNNGAGSSLGSEAVGAIIDSLFSDSSDGTSSDSLLSGIGLSSIASSFLTSGKVLSNEDLKAYFTDTKNVFDATKLKFTEEDGEYKIKLSEDQWKLVETADKNMYYDDGSGYVDLGYDNLFTFDDAGNMIADTDKDWISINGQPVAYYHLTTQGTSDDYTIIGRVPVLINGDRSNLILVFDSANKDGFIAGFTLDYTESGDTLAVAKNATQLEYGDTIDFLCDYWTYSGTFKGSYKLGDQMVVSNDKLTISNTNVGDSNVKITYRFTDIYNRYYWTDAITK